MPYKKAPNIYVFSMKADASVALEMVGVCDTYQSLIWDVEYYDSGQFEIETAATPELFDLFQLGRIVLRSDEDVGDAHTEFGVVEQVQLTSNSEDGDTLTISGRFLRGAFLSRRVINGVFTAEKAFQNVYITEPDREIDRSLGNFVYYVLRCNGYEDTQLYCTTEASRRQLIGFTYQDRGDWSQLWNEAPEYLNSSDDMQTSYKICENWIELLCKRLHASIHIAIANWDENDGCKFEVQFVEGTDRSDTIVFSDSIGNLSQLDYLEDLTTKATAVMAIGTANNPYSTGDNRILAWSYSTEKGWDCFEAIVDQSTSDDTDTSTETITQGVLHDLANDARAPEKIAGEGTAALEDNFEYKKDYFVGDLVSFRHAGIGVSLDSIRLVGMVESFSTNGYELTPTFKYDSEVEEE